MGISTDVETTMIFLSNFRNCLVFPCFKRISDIYIYLIRYIGKHSNTTHIFDVWMNGKKGKFPGIWGSRRAIHRFVAAIRHPWRCLFRNYLCSTEVNCDLYEHDYKFVNFLIHIYLYLFIIYIYLFKFIYLHINL